MISIRRTLPVAVALTFVVASCGGSSDTGPQDTEAPATSAEAADEQADDFTKVESTEQPTESEAPTTEEVVPEPAESAAPAEEPVETVVSADEPLEGADDADPAAASIDVSLAEWEIDAPNEYTAGVITFNTTNGGKFPHEFVVIEGEGYEALPLAEGGAVIEDDLPTGALIGRAGRIGPGSSESLTVTLAPGNYVLLCNLGGGNNSHAGQGQRLDISVS